MAAHDPASLADGLIVTDSQGGEHIVDTAWLGGIDDPTGDNLAEIVGELIGEVLQ